MVGTVTDGQALVEKAPWLEPDIIIADISMPHLNGLEATRVLRATVPKSKVIILTGHHDSTYVTMAFHMGASGYLLKRSAVAELQQAVLHVFAGECYVGLGVREGRDRAC